MSSIRGRSIKTGGMVVDVGGATARTDASQQTRPAFKMTAGIFMPRNRTSAVGGGSADSGHGHLIDPSSVSFWRLVIFGGAVAYIVGFHLSLGRTRLGIGPGK